MTEYTPRAGAVTNGIVPIASTIIKLLLIHYELMFKLFNYVEFSNQYMERV